MYAPPGIESPKLPLYTEIAEYATRTADKGTEITSVFVYLYVR
jgi:hypothetical protein